MASKLDIIANMLKDADFTSTHVSYSIIAEAAFLLDVYVRGNQSDWDNDVASLWRHDDVTQARLGVIIDYNREGQYL